MNGQAYFTYIVQNKTNGKVYIGFTKNIRQRWNRHVSTAKRAPRNYWHRALNYYGRDGFRWSVIRKHPTKEEALKEEMYYISLFRSNDHACGYNSTPGGEMPPLVAGPDHHNWGKPMSEEQKAKLSLAMTGIKLGPQSESQLRKRVESCQRTIREKGKAPATPESRAKMSQAAKGRPKSPEHKARIAQAHREHWARKRAQESNPPTE